MKKRTPAKRNKKYIKKGHYTPARSSGPARSRTGKIVRMVVFAIMATLLLLTIVFRVRHYFIKHW